MDLVKYTTIPITESLLKLDSELNHLAVECFECIMRYMGDLPVTPELNEVKCVYTILMVRKIHVKTCFLLSNELKISSFLKTNSPENNSCFKKNLQHCHKFENLRDEVYCQLMKQTTSNKTDSCQRGWRLLSIVAAYFMCSETLRPFLLKYLETAAYDKRRAFHGNYCFLKDFLWLWKID